MLFRSEFAAYIKPFVNSTVRAGEQIGEPVAFLNQFLAFYKNKQEGEIVKLLKDDQFTDEQIEAVVQYMGIRDTAQRRQQIEVLKGLGIKSAIITRIDKIVEKENFIEDNSNTLLGILAMYKRIVELKLLIISKLRKIENIGTFIKTEDGYKVTAPEGFVAIGHEGGAVKLVDRIEFSRQNFLAPKQWKKP